MVIDLKFDKKIQGIEEPIVLDQKFKIKAVIFPAFHREIGGAMKSINLKFEISSIKPEKLIQYKVGFLSDTDGFKDYLPIYCSNFYDCDFLILHLGAIHKKPNGYKHLYFNGVVDLLNEIKNKIENDKKPIIFLGEFGFELCNDQAFHDAIKTLTNENPKMETIPQYYLQSIIDKSNSVQNPINKIYAHQIMGNFTWRSIIDIFFDHNEILKKIIETKPQKLIESSYFSRIWRDFIKKEGLKIQTPINELIVKSYLMDVYPSAHLKDFFKFIKNFLLNLDEETVKRQLTDLQLDLGLQKYFSRISRIKLRSIKEIPKGIKRNDIMLTEALIENLKMASMERNVPVYYYEFILYIFFLVKKTLKGYKTISTFQDLRQNICKLLQKKSEYPIFPAHPSYTILIENSGLKFQSSCHKCKSTLYSISFSELKSDSNFIINKDDQFYLSKYICDYCQNKKEEDDMYFSQFEGSDAQAAEDFEEEIWGYAQDIENGLKKDIMPETIFILQYQPLYTWGRLAPGAKSKIIDYIGHSSVKDDYFLFLFQIFEIRDIWKKVLEVIEFQLEDLFTVMFGNFDISLITMEFIIDIENLVLILDLILEKYSQDQRTKIINYLITVASSLHNSKKEIFPKLLKFLRKHVFSELFNVFWDRESINNLSFTLQDTTIKDMWDSTHEFKIYSKIYQILDGKITLKKKTKIRLKKRLSDFG
jgi:hypothetical protein